MEINFTYLSWSCYCFFCIRWAIFIAIFYGFVASCAFSIVFLHKAKQERLLCAA